MVGKFIASYGQPAVFYSLLWRFSMAASGLVSIVVIGRCLSPNEQGYWFSFDSLAATRTVFELGFSMVLMQVASHEYPRLRWEGRLLLGEPDAKARLSALLRRSLKWYLGVASLTVIICAIAGWKLFGGTPTKAGVEWQLPWAWSVGMTVSLIMLTPCAAMLEGSGKIAAVARVRLFDALVSSCGVWCALFAGKRLYALPIGLTASLVVQLVWFSGYKAFFVDIWHSYLPSAKNFWSEHIWPFQKRIAISFISGYFLVTILNPLAFAVVGPVQAGRFGITLLLGQGITSLSTAVVKASAPRFGELITQRMWTELDRAFKLSLAQSLTLACGAAAISELGILALNMFRQPLALRLLDPIASAAVLSGAILGSASQAFAIYLRAAKNEPLLRASVTIAALSVPINYLLLRWLGSTGIAIGFLLLNGLNGTWAMLIFLRHRRLRTDGILTSRLALLLENE